MSEEEVPTGPDSMDTLGVKLMIERHVLQQIIGALASRGYRVIGPPVRDGTIIYETVTRLEDLPAGWTDRQEAGRYRIEQRGDARSLAMPWGPIPGNDFCIRL